MEINERDYEFMLKVKDAYERSGADTAGSIRAVAMEFNLSRTKVRKILITLGVIESEITEKALALKERGMSLEDIAKELGCSTATVSTYLPYDTVIYNGEERSPGAIRHIKYRERNKLAAGKQVQRIEKSGKDEEEDMKERECKALRLRLELNIDGADMETLRKYGKVRDGITREVWVPANMNLHALHYLIQKAFGWQNSHLHHFSLPEDKFSQLTQNRFTKWADYCGIYFRFPTDDFADIYWDDDYDESVSVKTWLKRKYTGAYRYRGYSEHFMEAKAAVYNFMERNGVVRVSPAFTEWMKLSEDEREELIAHPRVKNIEDATCDEMQAYFIDEGGLGELLERLRLSEILGEEAGSDELEELVAEDEKRFEDNITDVISRRNYRRKMSELDGAALPITKELVYEYDYGDGWEVKITLLGECSDEEAEALKNKAGRMVPVCVAIDGLPVLDDVGGVHGFCEMLKGINGEGSQHFDYDDPEETREWARMQGWTGRMSKAEKLV